ncbi:ARPC5 [Chondrus crispus]|uniref:ARPC5 n=1 Tax=Chondrus crispus TaxID=2769 RepID=R7QN59_CHOCR|nr:ARPC5 [Chondrus crispus]CDF39218.1 ARPC5 [Chondrus crispus]|eukprot:XP_005719129.1 ARPC5 [Chondrus crispus]
MYQVEGTVPSIIVDAGSHTMKAGIAGEDLPRVLIPAVLAGELEEDDREAKTETRKYKNISAGHYALSKRRDNVEIASPFGEAGLVDNWDLFEQLLSHTFKRSLRIETRENAMLFSDPIHNGRKARERIAELMFEKFEVPAVYLARSAVLSAYANGRTTGIVLDVGHSGTSAVPVEDGAMLKGKFIRTAVAGRTLNERLQEELIRKSLSFPKTTKSFELYSKATLLEEVKAAVCVVHENPTTQLTSLPMVNESYELPDGNTVEMGAERFAMAEETIFSSGGGDHPQASQGLHGLVIDAIRLCDSGVHRDMYAGVCLTGGTSDMGGLFERLSFGLLEMYHKVRVLAATGSHERKYCAWTGGSILATFPEFQKMWFSRSEYDENGSSFVHRKCQ